ncbi:adenosylmethionine--8-amino-7-oxononanoate transaminase [Methylobacillus flagellatus]|uniref:adenosylmethionine--8-amino-7-oxononanoate transaminase n=1 Tax=Methylobacillus flagellatus TaxID=405 RepID=UPI002854172E|nr:adenosylmethionine--8-amino-7-oxononanoate transaminase [Methylobacillus flagellatus]MDR5170417.1 adenosylmethionine--8-amino-7-oxononanoate transaminase [Methylobacillus flagellatus]
MTTSNASLLQRSLASVWHPCTQMKQHEALPLVPVRRGEGVWLEDFDGKRYLDGVSSWWVNLFGHNHPHIKQAIAAQLDQLEHVILAGFTHEPVVRLSEQLSALTGLGHSFYASDGASATEIALKMSFHYWRNHGQPGKTRFLSLQNGYHGETLGSLSVTDVALFKDTYAPLLRESVSLPSPDWRLAEPGESAEQYALRCAERAEAYIAEHHAAIAAVIVEPLVQCAAGMAMYHPIYLQRLRALCDRYRVHLIADEIAVGFGRTGTMFATEQAGIKADFICLSKGITGGYLPLSVVQTTDDVYAAFYDDNVARGFLHSHSYTGNALACSAALATLEIFAQQDVLNSNRRKADYLNRKLAAWQNLPIVHLRNTGMIWAFDAIPGQPGFQQRFYQAALQRGLLLRPVGNTVYFMPPYVISEKEMDWMLEQALAALEESI